MLMEKKSKEDKFYIDTSALIRIFRFYPGDLSEQIWKKLNEMFISRQMRSHRFVYEEITTTSKNPDALTRKVLPLRDYFETIKYSQTLITSDIIKNFPGLIDPNNEKEQADPWLIAIALEEKKCNFDEAIYVVSEESEIKQNRIPAVCRHYEIEHINLDSFFKKIGVSFKMALE